MCARAARAYGERREIYSRMSWNALVLLSSPTIPPAVRQDLEPRIMAGESIWALGWAEGRSRYDFGNVTTTARRLGDSYILSGTKAAVIGAPWADKLIVSARTSGGPRDRGGISLFVVDRHSANLHLQGFKTIDGTD